LSAFLQVLSLSPLVFELAAYIPFDQIVGITSSFYGYLLFICFFGSLLFILRENSLNVALFQRIFSEYRDKNLISLHKFALKERIRLLVWILLWSSHAFWCGIDNSLCEIKWSGCHEGALVRIVSMLILHFSVLFVASFFFDFDYLLFEFIVSDLVLHKLLNCSLYLIFLIVYATSSKIKCLLV